MKTYTKTELDEIIRKHSIYLKGEDGCERADLRGANLSCADLSGADLSCANLSCADLTGADLSGADLTGAASGNNIEIKTLQLGKYYTVISADKISVGCQAHTADKWRAFTDREILEMDGKDGLAWWKEWKDVIFRVHATTLINKEKKNENKTTMV